MVPAPAPVTVPVSAPTPCLADASVGVGAPEVVAAPLPNYALYVELEPGDKAFVRELQGYVNLEMKGAMFLPCEDPHVTVMYGPTAAAHGEDATGIEAARTMYPEVDTFKDEPGLALKCAGVDVFDRPHQRRWILHLRVTCEKLSKLRAQLMLRYPAVADAARAAMCAAEAAGARNVLSLSPNDEGPEHFWAHVTLGTFTTAEDAERARKCAEDVMSPRRNFMNVPRCLFAKSLTHVSATSDTFTRMVEFS